MSGPEPPSRDLPPASAALDAPHEPSPHAFPLTGLPLLNADDVRLLWINDWYDGPLDAIAEYRDEHVLFVLHDHDLLGTNHAWKWVLFRMTPEQTAEETRWHRLFIEHVGAHWDCTGEVYPEPSGHPDRFYSAHAQRAPRELHDLEPLGWLDTMPGPKGPGPLR